MSLRIDDKLYTDLRIEKAYGDGNCAFGAFFLGWVLVLDRLERRVKNPDESYEFFVGPAAKALGVPENWVAVTKAILALHKTEEGKIFLQKKIAPVMRNIAVDSALNDPAHKERTIQPLLSAFDNYLNKREGDDIFKHHPFIIEKFKFYKKLMPAVNEDEILNQLKDWWENGDDEDAIPGYKIYMNALRQPEEPGQKLQYGDDLLLQPLARRWDVILDVMLKGNEGKAVRHGIHGDVYARMPKTELVKKFRLNADQIKKLEKSSIVVKEMSSEEELVLSPNITTESLKKLTDMNDNINAVIDYYKPPVITVTNPDGKHYDNVLPDMIGKADMIGKDILEDTLKLAEQWHKTRVKNHYKKMIGTLKKEAKQEDVPADEGVLYPVSASKSIFVSKEKQEELDEAYAKQLQLEEYEGYLAEKNANKPRKKDRRVHFADDEENAEANLDDKRLRR